MFNQLLEQIKATEITNKILETVEFVKGPVHDPSIADYKIYKDGKWAGEYTIELRKTSVHIIGAEVDPEFRGQGITKQFVSFLINKYSPNFITAGSAQSAIGFWEKMGFKQMRKDEIGGTTYMLKWV